MFYQPDLLNKVDIFPLNGWCSLLKIGLSPSYSSFSNFTTTYNLSFWDITLRKIMITFELSWHHQIWEWREENVNSLLVIIHQRIGTKKSTNIFLADTLWISSSGFCSSLIRVSQKLQQLFGFPCIVDGMLPCFWNVILPFMVQTRISVQVSFVKENIQL